MTAHEIVALRCPSCGGASTQPSREMPFGAEFRCEHCGITSVLIVDRALVPLSTLQKQGEKVCTTCGRVAQREARFCQEGHALVRRCINSSVCKAEFAVDHQICDSCGWPQRVKPGTNEAEALAFERAVSDLDGPSYDVINPALKVIIAGGAAASDTAKSAAVSAILRLMTDSSFRQRSLIGEDCNYTERDCWQALGSFGVAAKQAAPLLRQKIEKLWSEEKNDDPALTVLATISPDDAVPLLRRVIEKRWPGGWRSVDYMVGVLGTISPQDALAYCSRSMSEKSSNEWEYPEVRSAFNLGKDAIPTLEEFSGIFSGQRGKACKAAVTALRNGEKTFRVP